MAHADTWFVYGQLFSDIFHIFFRRAKMHLFSSDNFHDLQFLVDCPNLIILRQGEKNCPKITWRTLSTQTSQQIWRLLTFVMVNIMNHMNLHFLKILKIPHNRREQQYRYSRDASSAIHCNQKFLHSRIQGLSTPNRQLIYLYNFENAVISEK